MGRRHKPEEIIGKLREAEIVLAQGGTTADACRRIAVAEQTCQRWRKEYGGPKTDQARRMKDLEKDNLRLRRAISDPTLDKPILQEASRGNFRARRGEGAASIMYAASWQYPRMPRPVHRARRPPISGPTMAANLSRRQSGNGWHRSV